jgi:protein-tyrosine phosphatase
MMSPAELKDLLERDQAGAKVLLLDLRVSPQFAQSRVRGALNLCIPTTLLKRPTFNLQKLQQTFQTDPDQQKFSNWRDADHLVVYDASSSDKRDAVSAINMIKKFTNEGYTGPASILRGGFNAFASAYPDLIDRSSGGPSPGLSLGANSASGGFRANLPPVIGGVLLPNANDSRSPFFNNIRQNQDLVDGVGQMDIGVPSGLSRASLPRWLREAAETSDHGKRVSDRFLHIERTEQSRMREAYSIARPSDVTNAGGAEAIKVQLSGIEKGGKNRYKDILPFEHARVRLMGRPEGVCDYVNASHLQARRSHKRYIASQGPLPATFEVRMPNPSRLVRAALPRRAWLTEFCRTFGQWSGTMMCVLLSC